MPIGFNPQARAVHPLFGQHRMVQGFGKFAPQAFARHFQNVVDARVALRRLQVQAGAAVQVQNIARAVDQCRHRGDLRQQSLLRQFAQRHLGFCSGFAKRWHQGGVALHRRACQKAIQSRAPVALKVFLALVQLGLAIQHAKQAGMFTHGF